jgi:kelch-like protein 17 (actinfilin)
LQVEELISSSQLNIASEEKVFTAVMNWMKHDLAGREQHVAQVASSVLNTVTACPPHPTAPI